MPNLPASFTAAELAAELLQYGDMPVGIVHLDTDDEPSSVATDLRLERTPDPTGRWVIAIVGFESQ